MLRGVKRLGAKRPTLLLRCLLVIAAELAVNALLWIVAAIVFRQRPRFLSLCLLAWTLGLRHALDADHISVIDNATRRIVSLRYTRHTRHTDEGRVSRPRRPVTCGLWFSLGHSTIVVAVICAIAISLGIVDRLGKVSSVGGIIGAAVSGSTLFLFAVVNSILLYQSVVASRTHRANQDAAGPTEGEQADKAPDRHFRGIFTRLAYPLFRLVDRPYKLYPVGILFGLGFDTASSIALLGIAGATNTQVQDTELGSGDNILPADANRRSDAAIVLLALLFTAGMTLVDSLDSVLMINAYAPGELLAPVAKHGQGASAGRWAWLRRLRFLEDTGAAASARSSSNTAARQLDTHDGEIDDAKAREDGVAESKLTPGTEDLQKLPELSASHAANQKDHHPDEDGKLGAGSLAEEQAEGEDSERGTGSTLSQLLTLLSILLAFAISIITLLGLIGENCDRCARAASKQDETHDGGLEGRWWLFWQQANDASGIIGSCIVGGFAAILLVWYASKAILRRYARRNGHDH